jgi:hypothetical protein
MPSNARAEGRLRPAVRNARQRGQSRRSPGTASAGRGERFGHTFITQVLPVVGEAIRKGLDRELTSPYRGGIRGIQIVTA